MKTNQANNPDRALTSNEYVEALVRCAYGRYKAKAKTNLTECVKKVCDLKKQVLVYVKCTLNVSEVR